MSERTVFSESQNPLETSFVPRIIKRQFSRDPEWCIEDETSDTNTSLLWLDICNFSTLCNRLMKKKKKGVEAITSILREHYTFLLDKITKYGGEPLFFAGDGIMASWPGNASEAEHAISLAVQCAREIIAENEITDNQGTAIELHLVIAYGPWHLAEIEGTHGKKLLTFYGAVFDRLRRASGNTAPNRILIHNDALAYLPKDLPSTPVSFDSALLEDVEYELPKVALPSTPEALFDVQTLGRLKEFIPATIPEPLSKERIQWLAEIRPVTSIFLRFPKVAMEPDSLVNEIHKIGSITKPLVEKYDGLLNMFWVDEKATNILICFGPSPSAHNNNPERSLRLAVELNRKLQREGFENKVGISTGIAYCGVLGNDIFRQHTVIGDVVNLSSRYSQISDWDVVCDEATQRESRRAVEFEGPFAVRVKGYGDEVQLYPVKDLIMADDTATPVLIWEKELQEALGAIEGNAQGNTVLFIEGQSGMGKTSLLHEIQQKTKGRYSVFQISGDQINRNTPYSIWSDVFSEILNVHISHSDGGSSDKWRALENRFGARTCLLNIVLNTNFEDSEEVRGYTPAQRVAATHDLLLEVLRQEGESRKLVILIDDAQWVDEISWNLIESINNSTINCDIALSLHKLSEQRHIRTDRLKHYVEIQLQELSDAGVESLICHRMNVRKVSEELVVLVHKIAKGNPFFSMEFLESLMDKDLLVTDDTSCSLKRDVVLSELSLPETVRGAVRSRIDRLDQGSQLSLKVGSVVGQRFGKGIVTEIYPIPEERTAVTSYLEEAQHFGLLSDTTVDDFEGYLFNNAAIAEVAYEMILAEQRRHLHRESAEWYENNFKDQLQPFYMRLMYHWNAAEEVQKAIHYCQLESMRLFQLGFVQQALEVGLQGAELLDFRAPEDAAAIGAEIGSHMAAIGGLLEGRSIAELIDHKPLQNLETELLIDLLLYLSPLAHQCHQAELFALFPVFCLQRTLEEGNGPSAAEVYSMYSIIHKALTGDDQGAFQWSNLALEVDRKNNHTRQARVSFIYCWFIAHWFVPYRELIPMADQGADAGFRLNDILYACFNLSLSVVLKCVCGFPLEEVVRAAEENLKRNNQLVRNAAFHLVHEKQVARAFQGKTRDYLSFSDDEVDEATDLASILNTDMYNQIGYYLISKVKLNVHYHQWEKALEWSEKAAPLLQAFANQPGHVELEQYTAMAALYASRDAGQQQGVLDGLANEKIALMEKWAGYSQENFHQYDRECMGR